MNNLRLKTKTLGRLLVGTLLAGSMVCPALGSYRVMVAWNPNPEPDIAGYKIHYGTSSRVYDVVLDVGNVTNKIIENLPGGNTYYFAATAYNTASLESDLSAEVSLALPLDNQPPTLSLPGTFAAQKQTATPLRNVQVSDPDGNQEIIQLNLGVTRGNLVVSGSVSGGVTAGQITGNQSKNVQVTAPLAALNTTLASASGLVYTGQPNLVGPDPLLATVRNSGSPTAGGDSKTAQIQVTGDSLDTWRNQYFSEADLINPALELTVYGDKADPEQDGLDNLLEYALGLSPTEKEALEPAVEMGIIEQGNAEKFAWLRFPRRKNQSLLQYQTEVSSDKVTWFSGSGAVLELSRQDRDAEFEVVTFQDLTPITPANTRFIRLKVLKTN